jgi:LysM repeat protein
MKCNLIILFLLGGYYLQAMSPVDSIRLEERKGNYFIIHQVDAGETVFSIARRYGVDSKTVVKINRIRNNDIQSGQFLEIPYGEVNLGGKVHTVDRGETLFSIATTYGVTVEEIKKWNRLRTSRLSIGQELRIEEIIPVEKPEPDEPSFIYYVQTGETLQAIADRVNVPVDSIMIWNDLKSSEVTIGQSLTFPFEVKKDSIAVISEVPAYTPSNYGSKLRINEEGGVKRVIEEGIARKIDTSLETDKYLALHRDLDIGDVIEVKNLMNNTIIYVRVVGKLPDTGINQNVMVRFTSIAFKRLGIIDDKALVELTYFKD